MRMLRMGGAIALGLMLLGACHLYRNDRQFLWETDYRMVRAVYDKTGSVDLVREVLQQKRWTRGQINEAMYRLNQDYSLSAEGVPRGIDRPEPVVPEAQNMPGGLGIGPGTGRRGGSRGGRSGI